MVLSGRDAVPVYLGGKLRYVLEFDLRTEQIYEFDPHLVTVDVLIEAEYVGLRIFGELPNAWFVPTFVTE